MLTLAWVLFAAGTVSGSPPSPDAAACLAKGGVIRPVCLSQTLQCVIPYPDAGRPCTDRSQCKGECRAVSPRSGQGARAKGVCQANNDPCGCRTLIIKGRIGPSTCAD